MNSLISEKHKIFEELKNYNTEMLHQSKDYIENYFDICRQIADNKKIIIVSSIIDEAKYKKDKNTIFHIRNKKIQEHFGDNIKTENIVHYELPYEYNGITEETYNEMSEYVGDFICILQTPNKIGVVKNTTYMFEIRDTYKKTLEEKRKHMIFSQILYGSIPKISHTNKNDDQFIDFD